MDFGELLSTAGGIGSLIPGGGLIGGGIGALGGLLGAGSARKRAEEARQNAMAQIQSHLNDEYARTMANDQYNLGSLGGTLNDVLASSGRTLGSSLAGAGVYNSSAAAGALSNLGAQSSRFLTDAGVQARQNEQRILGQNQNYLSGLQLGQANSDLQRADQNYGVAAQGFGGMLQNMGQLFPQKPNSALNQGTDRSGQSYGPAASDQSNWPQFGGMPNTGQFGLNRSVLNPQGQNQSMLQTGTQQNLLNFGVPSNNIGPAQNGMFNSSLRKNPFIGNF